MIKSLTFSGVFCFFARRTPAQGPQSYFSQKARSIAVPFTARESTL